MSDADGFQPRERGVEELDFPQLADVAPCLRFEAIVVIPRAIDQVAANEFVRAAVRALGDHDLGPTSWLTNRWPEAGDAIQIADLDWRLSLELQGTWRARRVQLEIWTRSEGETSSAAFYIDWEWWQPGVLIDPLVVWMLEVRRLAGEGAYLAHSASLQPEMKLVHRRPRVSADFSGGGILDIVDTVAPSWSAGLRVGFERMLPERTRRQVAGAVQVLRWARDPLTLDEIQRAVLAREHWVATALRTHQDHRWNDRGDLRCDYTYDCRSHPPLARYCANLARGFVEIDGDVSDDRLDEIASWRARGSVPDGTPISRLDAVCPSRDAAVALYGRLHARGLGTTYKDVEIWDPFPEGYVRDPPEASHLELVLECEVPEEDRRLVPLILSLLDERGIGAGRWRVRSDTEPDQLRELDTLVWPTREVELVGESPEPSILVCARGRLLEARVRWPWRDGLDLMAPLVDALLALGRGGRLARARLIPRGLALRSLARPCEMRRRPYGALLEANIDGHAADALPAPATRHVGGTLEVVQWAFDPLRLEEVERAWIAQQRWARARLAAELSWNELGDLRVTGELEPRPPLTLFDEESGAGYKAVYVEPDGTMDDDGAFNTMASFRASGVFGPDRTPIASITLVCPTREAALALEGRAKAHRLGVGYARGNREIWIVHPEGWEP